MHHPRLLLLITCLALLAASPVAVAASKDPASTRPHPSEGPKLPRYDTPYYTLYTDLDKDSVREAYIRMTKMFEVYKRRTAGFSRDNKGQLPFYLYKNLDDYKTVAHLPDSAGEFRFDSRYGSCLIAYAGRENPDALWHTVQHEGFHQFAHAVISSDLPTWANEGLAEYFGEALFTGDDFITGIIRERRLLALQTAIQDKSIKPLKDMLAMTAVQWKDDFKYDNYTQAWSMIHFLAHGENGKFQQPFTTYMARVAAGRPSTEAWSQVFGNDPAAFQKRWETWWLARTPDASRPLYERATVLTLTSFLARAASQGQTFPDAEAFFAAADAGSLKAYPEDYLPSYMLTRMLKTHAAAGDWALTPGTRYQPMKLILTTRDGAKITATYTLNGNRVRSVTAETQPPPTTAPK